MRELIVKQSSRGRLLLPALMGLALLAAPVMARAQVPGRPPARDTARAAPAARDTPQVRKAGADTVAPQPLTLPSVRLVVGPPPDPWFGFALRSVVYVGAIGGGLLLTTGHQTDLTQDYGSWHRMKNRAGLAVAAGAFVVGITDALITAHHIRTHRAATPPESAPLRTGLLPPAVESDGPVTRIALVRFGF